MANSVSEIQTPAPSASEGIRRPVLVAAFLCALIASSGCGTRPYVNAHIESVNAEYRQLEDYVYALEAENGRLQQELESLKTAGASTATPTNPSAPRTTAPRRPPAMMSPRLSPPASGGSTDIESPAIEIPGSSPSTIAPRSTTQRPSLDLPAPSSPADTPPNIDIPPLLEVPSPSKPSELLPVPGGTRETSKPLPSNPTSSKPGDKKVTHLFLNPALTGAADFDGQSGDDGLRIVVEPRNAEDQLVPEAGSIAIVVLDPDQPGDRARLARWDFDRAAIQQLLADSSPHRGIKLEMPWPASAPAANRLKLFVRYETPDGRKVQADREIFMAHGDKALSRWTPRSTDRTTATAAADSQQATPIRSASATDLWPSSR
jgi:hypothetical protein